MPWWRKILAVVLPKLGERPRLARCPICGTAWITDNAHEQVCRNAHYFNLDSPGGSTGPEPDPNAPHGEI